MKYNIFLFLMFSFYSCNEISNEDINNVEFLLGTELNVKYEIINVESPFDFANNYSSFDLKFHKNDFDSLLKNIDFSKFEKLYNELEFQTKPGYYRA